MQKEVIKREVILAAFRLICEKTRRDTNGRCMSGQEVEAFMQKVEAAILAAPAVKKDTDGFQSCKHYPRDKGTTGCALLTERVCAIRGKCSFYCQMDDELDEEPEARPRPALADNLKAARMAAGLSTTQLMVKIGISRQSINKWENGERTPTADNLAVLADVLGVSVEELQESRA